MKPNTALRRFLAIAGSAVLIAPLAHAADGTWNVDADGLWSGAGNWTPGIADGSGSTANFTNDITADRTVSLDGDRTLTSLVFDDSDTATAGSWILDNNGTSTNNLILAGTTPGITVNALGTGKTATISAIIEGTAGLVKSGNGTLILSGANTYTGTTTVNGGRLVMTSTTNSSAYSVVSGATLEMDVVSGTRDMGSSSTFTGAGTFIKSGGGELVWGSSVATWNFGSGALIDVQGGKLTAGGYANEVWTNNKADLNVAAGATFDAVEATSTANGGVFVDALTGAGTIKVGYSGSYANRITFGVDNGSSTFTGSLQDSSGAGNYVKAGTGTQTLSGNNTYTGTTTVSAGTLLTTKAAALPGYNSSAKVIINGGTIGVQVGGAGWTTTEVNTLLTNATKTSGALGIDTTNGNLTQWTPFTTTNLGSALGLTKLGSNTLTLDQTNTYTGTTTVSAGTLQIGSGGSSGTLGAGNTTLTSPASLAFNRSDTYTYGGNISGTGSLKQIGAGTTILGGGSIDSAISIEVSSGTLALAESGTGRTLANNIVLNGGTLRGLEDNTGTGGTITLSGGLVTHTFTSSGTLYVPTAVTASELIVGGGGGAGGGQNSVAYSAGGGGGQVLNLTGQAIAAGNTTVTVGAGGAGQSGSGVAGSAGGASSIGSNTAAGGLGGANVGIGGASGSGFAGGLKSGSYASGGGGGDSAAGTNGIADTNGGNGGAGTVGTITGLTYGGGGGGGSSNAGGTGGAGGGGNGGTWSAGTSTAGAANTGGGGGGGGSSSSGGSGIAIVQYAYGISGGGTVTLNGTIDLQSASTLDAYGSGGLLSVNGVISTSAGAGGLTIASSNSAGGVVRFGSANTYLGNTTVNTGATLRMNATNALPNGSGKGNLSLSGTLDLNGQTTTSLNGLSGAGTIDNNSGAGTYALSVGNNDQTSTFSGVIQNTTGTIALTKAGTGTQTLTGVNTYTGPTTVSQGTLEVNGSGSINNTSSLTINSGATFRYNSSTALTVGSITNSGTIAGSGNLNGITLGGTGSVDPGNSPGILTVSDTNPSGGLDYNFEMTAGNTLPTWNNATASINDVLRLTGGAPFTSNLGGANVISVYFGSGVTPTNGDIFTGGFYTDNNASFLSAISSATFQYFVYNASGGTSYNGNNYDVYGGPAITVGSVPQSADFGGGTVNGYVTQFTVIPEPSTALLGGLGLLALLRRRR